LKGLGCVVCAITFDLVHFALFAFRCCAEGARFADGEGSGVDIGRKVESVGDGSDCRLEGIRLARTRGDVLRVILFYALMLVRHGGFWSQCWYDSESRR
jgi:hypothetical protein